MSKNTNAIAEFGLYRQVDATKRDTLAKIIEGLDLGSYEGVAEASRAIMVNLLRGDMPTGVSAEAREHLTMMLSALSSKAKKEAGGYGPGAQVLVNVMNEVRRAKPVQGHFVRSAPAAIPAPPIEPLTDDEMAVLFIDEEAVG